MKKSFKKVVAVLLAVMMVVCSFPLTVLAADDNKTNINLRFGSVTNSATNIKNYTTGRGTSVASFITYSGLNSAELAYSNGKIDGYGVGDFFTVSVVVENITKLSSAEVALKYSDSITPAYINQSTSPATKMYTESGTANEDFKPLESIQKQSGNAIYNTTSTVGETSYIDADNKVIHANFAVQTGADDIDVSGTKAITAKCSLTNAAVLATFMFKIVSDDAISFSVDSSNDTFYLNTIANGGSTDEYKTYAPKVEGETPEMTFMGENEFVEPSTKSYTITFVDADGKTLSTGKYEEGTSIVAPQLPAVTHDDAKHYTYAWDKEIPATATADGTYTIVKTGADHTWNEGVVTKEPTTTEFGEKTYTCTLDGCGATKTEQLPKKEEAHTHTWGEWKYNGDAEYTSSTVYKDGTSTRTCSTCGETETKTIANTGLLRVRTLNADFGGKIAAMFAVKAAQVNAFDEVYAVVTRADGVQDTIPAKKFYSSSTNVWFNYGITPQGLNSSFTVRYYAVKDGETYWGPDYEYNMITNYVRKQLDKSTSTTEWKTLLVEMLYYGTEAQNYTHWDTANPIINVLSDEEKALHSTEPLNLVSHKNNSYKVIDNPKAVWKSLNVTFGAGTELRFKVAGYVPNDSTKVVVEVNGQTYTYNYADEDDKEYFEISGSDTWFIFADLLTKYLRTPVDITYYEGDTQISNTYRWSAESYCAGRTTAKSDYALTQQLMRFGNAARAYFGVN